MQGACDEAIQLLFLWIASASVRNDVLCHVPEVMDLNVLPSFRKMGIGVGLYAGEDGGYGEAQRLYIKRGYIPDGKGVTYNYQPAIPGNSYPLDDGLVLMCRKKLR